MDDLVLQRITYRGVARRACPYPVAGWLGAQRHPL